MKIKSIAYAGKEDVYNVTVDEAHTFVANGGFITHNCDALRYMCQSRPITPALPKEQEIIPFDPLDMSKKALRRHK